MTLEPDEDASPAEANGEGTNAHAGGAADAGADGAGTAPTDDRIPTGIDGLDGVLEGGLIRGRSYLLRGQPGTGKTLFGAEFLSRGVTDGETALFVNLEESEADVRRNAAAAGVDVSGVAFLDLRPEAAVFTEGGDYDVFAPAEVEQEHLSGRITETVESLEPDRVFVDPLTKLRHVAAGESGFRDQVIGFMRYLKEQGATIVFTSQDTEAEPDTDLQFLSDGTVDLANGAAGRTLSVPKFRGSDVREGAHTLVIGDDGLSVYPKLQLESGTDDAPGGLETISSGVPEVDELLNGGLERGTVTIISGPTGVGKTTTGSQFMKEAAGRGERSVIYLFEESKETFYGRTASINMPVREMVERGSLAVREVEPLSMSVEEFADDLRHEVEERGAETVMIDGISGFKLSVRGEGSELVRDLHVLGRYLKNRGVTVVFVEEMGSVTGDFQPTEEGVSYLADNILILRYLEIDGEMRKAVGVLKKRTSDFERTLREFRITEYGIEVGEPLTGLRGILTGTPTWPEEESEGRERPGR